jgi:hypothetical protein
LFQWFPWFCFVVQPLFVGVYIYGLEYTCSYLWGFFWYNELATHLSAFTQKRMFYNHCCKGSKIHLPVYKSLVRFGEGSESTEFMQADLIL